MANKALFKSLVGKQLPATDTVNAEAAPAYRFSPKHTLAQYAVTGCLNGTFYASAEQQLETVLALCKAVDAEFVAKTAVYCREQGYMKDMPALLCAVLSVKAPSLLPAVFGRVIDSGKMLRNFVQILRSGVVGRKSLGSLPKRLVQDWLEAHPDEEIFFASVGQDPSIADVIKMVHPKPRTAEREALYGYLLGRSHKSEQLPSVLRAFEAYKVGETMEVPKVPFQMLTSLPLNSAAWVSIARNAGWQMTRMNLNTFARHGVFEAKGMSTLIANRLRDSQAIAKAKAFPYQLLAAYRSVDVSVPEVVRDALHDAMEVAIENVPQVAGKIYVCPDVSGSMSSPVTGQRKGASSALRCVDVAALVAASFLRRNPQTEVLAFETSVRDVRLSARDTVLTNAEKLAAVCGGGTNCSAPMRLLNDCDAEGELVIYISDNESWVDANAGRGTALMQEWERFRARNPHAKLICIDIQPYGTTQACEREDILNVGGFSDEVFNVVAAFADGKLSTDHWVGVIESVVV